MKKLIYQLVMLFVYLGMGIYFLLLHPTATTNGSSFLPSWSYPTFGVVLILYGIMRICRLIKNRHEL